MTAHALYLVTVNDAVYRTLLARCGVRKAVVHAGTIVRYWL